MTFLIHYGWYLDDKQGEGYVKTYTNDHLRTLQAVEPFMDEIVATAKKQLSPDAVVVIRNVCRLTW